MAYRIQFRRDITANWTSINPILLQGEFAFSLDTGFAKIGNGSSTWTQLPYFGGTGPTGPAISIVGPTGATLTEETTQIGFTGAGISSITASSGAITVSIGGGTAALKTASYTLTLLESNRSVEITSASTTTLTVPLNASVPFLPGTQIQILRGGTGELGITGAAGTTLRSPQNHFNLNYQYSTATLTKTEPNTWYLSGDLKA